MKLKQSKVMTGQTQRDGNTEWTQTVPLIICRRMHVEEGTKTIYDLSAQVVYDAPPQGLLPSGAYHPLCCSVRVQFHTDGFK